MGQETISSGPDPENIEGGNVPTFPFLYMDFIVYLFLTCLSRVPPILVPFPSMVPAPADHDLSPLSCPVLKRSRQL
jgi:hypothetical protein